jgi:hypothetical protein
MPGLGAPCVVPRATIDARLTDSPPARRRSLPDDEFDPLGPRIGRTGTDYLGTTISCASHNALSGHTTLPSVASSPLARGEASL